MCRYCEIRLTPATATLDHVWPQSKGGEHHPSNLVLSCLTCNTSKGAATVPIPKAIKQAAMRGAVGERVRELERQLENERRAHRAQVSALIRLIGVHVDAHHQARNELLVMAEAKGRAEGSAEMYREWLIDKGHIRRNTSNLIEQPA